MGVETEIKLATTPEMLARLLANPCLAAADGHEIHENLVSTYFDTADSRLHAAGAALRIREKARDKGPPRREQTLKLVAPHQAAIRRHEWNVALPTIPAAPAASPITANPIHPCVPDLALWPDIPRAALADLLDGADVHARGATHVTRIRRRIRHGTALIDIMADHGEIAAPTPHPARHKATAHTATRQPICELELELVEGDLADTLTLAATLPLGPDLIWLVAGKGARLMALAHGEAPRANAAPPVSLTRTMDIAAAFHAIGWSCLNHLLANYPLVLSTGDPDALHQSRVAIRRLRAAFSLFGKAVADAHSGPLRDGFKAAAAALAPARDAHVLIQRVSAELPDLTPSSPLLTQLAAARDAATLAAQSVLTGPAFQHLLVDFALWLERGDWRKEATTPLAETIATTLRRRQRRLRRHARAADLGHDDELHALRIEAKKLRYAIDFTVSALPTARARTRALRQEKLLGKLQNVLGDLHDIALAAHGHAHSHAHTGAPAETPPLPPFATALPAGDAAALSAALAAHSAALTAQTPQLRHRAAKLLALNANTPHWWQD